MIRESKLGSLNMDLEHFAAVLNNTTQTIKKVSEIDQKKLEDALEFIPKLTLHFSELESFGDLKNIVISPGNTDQQKAVISAIHFFLESTKEAQEKAGALGAALFGMPQFKEFKENLEVVKKYLEKGKKVDKAEDVHGL